RPFVDHVLVVADGSKDRTGDVARAAGAVVPEPEQVRGKGFAIIKGIEESRKLSPDVVILMDSDGQHLPEEIPVLLKPLEEGRDLLGEVLAVGVHQNDDVRGELA